MKKKIILTAVILLTIVYFLITSWITIISENYIMQWQHLTALLLFMPLPILLFKNYKIAVISTGFYLLLALFRVLSLTAGISTGFITIGGQGVSGFNWPSLGLFALYIILHLEVFIDMQLDHKENRAKNESQ